MTTRVRISQPCTTSFRRSISAWISTQAVWTFDPFFGSEPLYLQNYVLAEMFARQVHQTMDIKLGAKWRSPAGEFLKRNLFSVGARYRLDEVLINITGEPLSSSHLIRSLLPSSADGACP
jgi:Zn-dependent M32 family carboxypeptidase